MLVTGIRRSEKGVVMVAVLVIAMAVAIFSYTVLITSIDALERSDVQDYRVKAQALTDSGLDEAAFSVKQNPDYLDPPVNDGILPLWAGGNPNESVKAELLSDTGTLQEAVDDLPQQSFRVAKAEYERTSHEFPDLYFIHGDTETAAYEFIDEETYKRHFFDYHYNPYQQESDIIISATGEVDDNLDDHVFSFGSRSYPASITRFQARTNDAWEQNQNDPEPTFYESEHPYDTNINKRYWVVTYDYDPEHPGRNITRIDLIATPGNVELGSPGDYLWATGWNGTGFDPPSMAPPNYVVGPYVNTDNLITKDIDSTTIRIGLRSDAITDNAYGFKVDGIRYYFDSESYPAFYETPHPYDHLPAGTGWVQVVYSPFQFDSSNPGATNQMMEITFDWNFFLEAGDSLDLVNISASSPGVIATLTGSSGAGFSIQARRENPSIPLGIALIFKSDGDNASSSDNYGYLVDKIRYTDALQNWVTKNKPYMQTPHMGDLGTLIDPLDSNKTAEFNTIFSPHVPGGGVLTAWWVQFDEGTDLQAFNAFDDDVIRITTPGFNPFGVGGDVHYFVNPGGPSGWMIPIFANYHNINFLKGLNYPCGTSPYLEIKVSTDDIGEYNNSPRNWGFRVSEISYKASGANDYVPAPLVSAAFSRPPGTGYVNFGQSNNDRGEWWITEQNAEMVGVHIDLQNFDLDPGDVLAFYDQNDELVGTVTHRSFDRELPGASGPRTDDPSASGPEDENPNATGPGNAEGFTAGTINLNQTRGWVLVPGESAHLVLEGDADMNEEHVGFFIDRTAWWSGFVNYDTTGIFEKIDDLEKDVADYQFSESSEYFDIR